MKFVDYLANRHLYVRGYKGMKEVSAQQYANRFSNMVRKRIYNNEEEIDGNIIEKINWAYVNKSNEYERTLKYYLEYRSLLEDVKVDGEEDMGEELS